MMLHNVSYCWYERRSLQVFWDDDVLPSPACLQAYVDGFLEHPQVSKSLVLTNGWGGSFAARPRMSPQNDSNGVRVLCHAGNLATALSTLTPARA
jgi:hypothetical protein